MNSKRGDESPFLALHRFSAENLKFMTLDDSRELQQLHCVDWNGRFLIRSFSIHVVVIRLGGEVAQMGPCVSFRALV